MRLSRQPFNELLQAFRSPDPTPGGGSASALAGSVGASLLAMVASLPKPLAVTAEDMQRLRDAGERCASLSDRLCNLIDEDTDAYNAVVAAFRLAKGNAQERSARAIRIQEALRGATDVPLEVMRACGEALDLGGIVAPLGNRNAASDARVGMQLLAAGLRGAHLNVSINLESLKDEAYVAAIRAESNKLVARAPS